MSDAEDAKIITLARTARGRAFAPSGPAEGAAVRDDTGRTYAAATVEGAEPVSTTSALRAAYAAAVSSGARRFEAFALVAADPVLRADDRAVLSVLGAGVPVLLASPDGTLVRTEMV